MPAYTAEDFEDAAKHRIMRTFKMWDVDGNGTIEVAELARILGVLGLGTDKVDVIFQKTDLNKDGVLNYTEFMMWLFRGAFEELPQDAMIKMWFDETLKDVMKAIPCAKPYGDMKDNSMKELKARDLILRDKVVTIDSVDKSDGTTIIIAAAKANNADMVRWLTEQGCTTINTCDDQMFTPLDWATALGANKVIQFMNEDFGLRSCPGFNGRKMISPDAKTFAKGIVQAVEKSDVDSVREALFPSVTFQAVIWVQEGKSLGLQTSLRPSDAMVKGEALEVTGLISDGLFQTDWNIRSMDFMVKAGDILVGIKHAKSEVSAGDAEALSKQLGSWGSATERGLDHYEFTFVRPKPALKQDVNTRAAKQDGKPGTPVLVTAMKQNNQEIIDMFLAYDALQVNLKSPLGRTALDVATESGNSKAVEALKAMGAKLGSDVE